MEMTSRIKALLELVAAAGGEADTRIRIQKEAYLAAAVGVGDFSTQDFDYHYYGPFSRKLSNTLHTSVTLGLLEEIKEDFDSGVQRYRYRLTADGTSWIQEESPRFKQLQYFISRLKDEPWRMLELAATAVFLERKGRASSREAAIDLALQKKPETKPFELQARKFLEDLAV